MRNRRRGKRRQLPKSPLTPNPSVRRPVHAVPSPQHRRRRDLRPNLTYVVDAPAGGEAITIPRAASGDCAGADVRWVYDNTAEPIKILLCDEGCDLVDGDATGAVSIELGCEGSLPLFTHLMCNLWVACCETLSRHTARLFRAFQAGRNDAAPSATRRDAGRDAQALRHTRPQVSRPSDSAHHAHSRHHR